MYVNGPEQESIAYDVLTQDGWLQWNEETWGLKAHRVLYSSGEGKSPKLSGVLYTDSRGRVRTPPLSPFLPFNFDTTAHQLPRFSRQWHGVAEMLAEDLQERGMVGRIALSPGVVDVRPFQWSGMHVETKYTYTAPLPYSLETAVPDVRRVLKRAAEAGYRFEVAHNAQEIVRCLQSTAGRKGFEYQLTEKSLSRLFELLGDANCRGHIVRDSAGLVVSGGVQLISKGSMALNWVQGTEFSALRKGAAQVMYQGAFEDIESLGAAGFDFGGANTKTIAAAKANWGLPLTSYISLGHYGVRQIYKSTRGALSHWKASARPSTH